MANGKPKGNGELHRPLTGAAKLAHDAKQRGEPLPGKPFGAKGRSSARPKESDRAAAATTTPASSSAGKAPTWRERIARVL